MNFDKEIYKTIFQSSDYGPRDIMLLKAYCTVRDDSTRHDIAHKIAQFILSLQSDNFKVHLIDREHPTLNEKGDSFAYSTWHMHNVLDIDKLLERS